MGLWQGKKLSIESRMREIRMCGSMRGKSHHAPQEAARRTARREMYFVIVTRRVHFLFAICRGIVYSVGVCRFFRDRMGGHDGFVLQTGF